MCQYYKKLHTCGCISKCHLEMCRPGILTSTVCQPLIEPPSTPDSCRRSHFPCYDCLRNAALAERHAVLEKRAEEEDDKTEQEALRSKMRVLAEKRAKSERVRKEYAEKAIVEKKAEEDKVRREKEEKERAGNEGGLWIDAKAGRKKGRKGGVPSPIKTGVKPGSAPPTAGGRKTGDFAKTGTQEPKRAGLDAGGRAGVWGPVKKNVADAEKGANGWKK